jgi:hypothetical protein
MKTETDISARRGVSIGGEPKLAARSNSARQCIPAAVSCIAARA